MPYNIKTKDLLYGQMAGILMTHHQQITLDTVTPETEYKSKRTEHSTIIQQYYNTMLAKNEMFKAYIIANGSLE